MSAWRDLYFFPLLLLVDVTNVVIISIAPNRQRLYALPMNRRGV